MQNEVNFSAIEFHANALRDLAEQNRNVKQELYTILRDSDASEDTIVAVCFLLQQYEHNSEQIHQAVDVEKKRQMTTMQKILSRFV